MAMKNALLISLLFLFSLRVSADSNSYECYLKNIHLVDSKTLEFDIWLEWTGSSNQTFLHFGAGINFNYDGISNGGKLTGSFVPGSADQSLSPVQKNPNWNINQASKQIRLLSSVVTPSVAAKSIPPPPGVRLGTFRIKNTVDFNLSASPNFEWSFNTGTKSTTQTKMSFYLNGVSTGSDITIPAQHHVGNNSPLALNIDKTGIASLEFYPNPATNNLYISKNKNEVLKDIKVFSMSGQKANIQYALNSKSDLIDLNISDLAAGVYFIEVIVNNEVRTAKFIKE